MNGIAPDRVVDLNVDGVIDFLDAELMGYTLLSNEVVLEVRQTHSILGPCSYQNDPWGNQSESFWPGSYDFDHNGGSGVIVCPSGGGSGGTPPQ